MSAFMRWWNGINDNYKDKYATELEEKAKKFGFIPKEYRTGWGRISDSINRVLAANEYLKGVDQRLSGSSRVSANYNDVSTYEPEINTTGTKSSQQENEYVSVANLNRETDGTGIKPSESNTKTSENSSSSNSFWSTNNKWNPLEWNGGAQIIGTALLAAGAYGLFKLYKKYRDNKKSDQEFLQDHPEAKQYLDKTQ